MYASIHIYIYDQKPVHTVERTYKSFSTYIQPAFLPEIERNQGSEISLLVSVYPTLQHCTSQPIFTKLVMTVRISYLSTTERQLRYLTVCPEFSV
jgi:hypothetical protein